MFCFAFSFMSWTESRHFIALFLFLSLNQTHVDMLTRNKSVIFELYYSAVYLAITLLTTSESLVILSLWYYLWNYVIVVYWMFLYWGEWKLSKLHDNVEMSLEVSTVATDFNFFFLNALKWNISSWLIWNCGFSNDVNWFYL